MQSQRNRNKKRVNRASNGVNRQLGGTLDPPQIKSNIVLKHKYRFRATAAFTGSITNTRIAGALGGMATTIVGVSLLPESFRIRKVELWAPPPSQGAASTISLEWLGSANSPSLEVSDTTVSVSRPAHIVTKPPVQALSSFWQQPSGTVAFTLNVPTGTIIDLTVDWIISDSAAAAGVIVVAAAVIGEVYYLALDHGVSDLLVPVSLTTTV